MVLYAFGKERMELELEIERSRMRTSRGGGVQSVITSFEQWVL